MLLHAFANDWYAYMLFAVFIIGCILLYQLRDHRNTLMSIGSTQIPVANPQPWYWPSIFTVWKFAFSSRTMLEKARQKHGDQFYRLFRGDRYVTIVPHRFLAELNTLPEETLNARNSHSYNLTGHLNGIEVVCETSLHTQLLQNKVTPALPKLYVPMRTRIGKALDGFLSKTPARWQRIRPFDFLPATIGAASALVLVGEPLCDSSDLIKLITSHESSVFIIAFILRLCPTFLQRLAVWFVPQKWTLENGLRRLQRLLKPLILKQRMEEQQSGRKENPEKNLNVLSWMIEQTDDEAKTSESLVRLLGALIAGSTHSTANLVANTLFNLITHPGALATIREEIHDCHNATKGRWEYASFDSLLKLDSALKETMRVAPASLTVYARQVESDHMLSDGTMLTRGSMLAISGHTHHRNPEIFPSPHKFDAFRTYDARQRGEDAKAFKSVDDNTLQWGAGRWACPGRFLATSEAKIVLVKLINEYDFRLDSEAGKAKDHLMVLHEFSFANKYSSVQYKARDDAVRLPW